MKLRYSKRALKQIEDAFEYLAERSPSGAAKVEARMDALLALLRLQPHCGARTSLSGVRRVFLTPYPYLIDYVLADDEITVLRFRHTARRPVN